MVDVATLDWHLGARHHSECPQGCETRTRPSQWMQCVLPEQLLGLETGLHPSVLPIADQPGEMAAGIEVASGMALGKTGR